MIYSSYTYYDVAICDSYTYIYMQIIWMIYKLKV